MYFMGIDIGTTGCKAVVFDVSGLSMGSAYREYPIICNIPLQAEQDPELVFSLVLDTMGLAIKASGVDSIVAMSLSVQGDAVMPVDKDYSVLHNVILGMDYRSNKQCYQYRQHNDEWNLYCNTGQPLHPINMLSKIMWFRDERPSIFEKAFKFITYAEFIVHRLGGNPAIDNTVASRSMGYSIVQNEWSEEVLNTMGVTRSQLSEICQSGSELGHMCVKVAEKIGLKNTPLLVAGGHDQPLCAIGAGAIRQGMAVDSTGTAEVLSIACQMPLINRNMYESYYSCYQHAVPGLYFSFAHMQVGGILQRWYRDNIAYEDVVEAKKRQQDFYTYAHSRCSSKPSPILVLPHFNGSGTPLCDMDSKGAIIGLTLTSTRNDILKGIIDSLCYELKMNIDAFEVAGAKIGMIRAVGGGARSPLWLQAKADVTGRTVTTLKCKEAGCLGAAILSANCIGVYGSVQEAADVMVKQEATYEPDEQMAQRYLEKYDIYSLLYNQLKPINNLL